MKVRRSAKIVLEMTKEKPERSERQRSSGRSLGSPAISLWLPI